MKKILTVSLFAIMAVGAANADIASTAYVDNKVSTGVENKADKATTLGGYGIADAYTKTQIDNTVATLATKTELAGYATDGELSAVSAVADAAQTAQEVADAIDAEIAALKLGETYQTLGNLSNEIPEVEANQSDKKYTSEKAVAEYVAGKLEVINGDFSDRDAAIESAQSAANNAQDTADANADAIEAINDGTNGILAQAKADATAKANAAQTNAEATAAGALNNAKSELTTEIGKKVDKTTYDAKVGTANMGTTATTLTGAIAEVKGIADAAQTKSEVETLITSNAVNSVATGSTNGTILVDNQSVAVKGLGTAAYTNSDAYDAKGSAAAAQTAAIDAAKTAGDAAYAVKGTETTAANNTTAINTIKENLGVLDVKIPGLPAQTGMYSLVANDGVITWEKVNPGN